MPKVFVIHEPVRRDQTTGDVVPLYDISTAADHGDLTFVLPRGRYAPTDPALVLPALRQAMAGYEPHDSIVMLGDIGLVGWAIALAARSTNGLVKTLRWGRDGRYHPVPVQLWA